MTSAFSFSIFHSSIDCQKVFTYNQNTKSLEKSRESTYFPPSGDLEIKQFSLETIGDFKKLLEKQSPKSVLMSALSNNRSNKIISQKQLTEKYKNQFPPNTTCRTKNSFSFPDEGAILRLDYDAETKYQPLYSLDSLYNILETTIPSLRKCVSVSIPSASSCIYDGDTEIIGEKNQSIYFFVSSGKDIPAIGQQINELLLASGFGGYKLSADGKQLAANIFDGSVWSTDKIDFTISGAHLPSGFTQKRKAKIRNPDGGFLSLKDLPLITDDLKNKKIAHLKSFRELLKADAKSLREHFVQARCINTETLAEITEQKILRDGFVLAVKKVDAFSAEEVTVAQILADRKAFHLAECFDPIDGMNPDNENYYGRLCAKLYLDNATTLHTLAHGGADYTLKTSTPDSVKEFFANSDKTKKPTTQGNVHSADDNFLTRERGDYAGYILGNELQLPIWFEKNPLSHYDFLYDDFQKILLKKDRLTGVISGFSLDNDLESIRRNLLKSFWTVPSTQALISCITDLAMNNKVNLAVDWVENIEWDGVDRYSDYIRSIGSEVTDWTKAIAKYQFTSMAGRAHQPGIQADSIIIYQSDDEGQNKTKLLENIAPVIEGVVTTYHKMSLTEFVDREKAARGVKGHLVVNFDEMRGYSKREREEVFSAITQKEESFRNLYQKEQTIIKRQCTFFGTSNKSDLLDGDSQNRRYLFLHVKEINLQWLIENRMQMWAQGFHDYKQSGIAWEEIYKSVKTVNKDYTAEEPRQELLMNWVLKNHITSTTSTNALLKMDEAYAHKTPSKEDSRLMARSLKAVGFTRQEKRNSKGSWTWDREWTSTDDIAASEMLKEEEKFNSNVRKLHKF